MTAFYEIEPGVWIDPNLVASVRACGTPDDTPPIPSWTGATFSEPTSWGYSVLLSLCGGGEVRVRSYTNDGRAADEWIDAFTPEQWERAAEPAVREVISWLEERRDASLTFVPLGIDR